MVYIQETYHFRQNSENSLKQCYITVPLIKRELEKLKKN